MICDQVTETAAVEAVQWAFDAIRQGYTVGAVQRELRARKLKSVYGNLFTYNATVGLLANPAYSGTLQSGRYSRGKFCSLADEGLITVENAHEPLLAPGVFEEVQQILARRKRRYGFSKPGRYLLSGLITCQHCGGPLYGTPRAERHRSPQVFYQCGGQKCRRPAVRQDRLERFVLQTIRERLLETGAEERIRQAIVRAHARDAKQTSQDEKRLLEVRRKIERGTENLALADKRDFAGIASLLTRWREEEATLVERIERRGKELEPLPEALRVIARFAEIRDRLEQADRVKLAHAVRLTVASITIGTREAVTGKLTHRELVGELRFHEALTDGQPVAIPDTAIGQRKIWREIGQLARQSGRPLRLADVCEYIGSPDPSHACYHMRRATHLFSRP